MAIEIALYKYCIIIIIIITEKLPIQDSMIKLGTKYGISRRVSRLVLTLSLL